VQSIARNLKQGRAYAPLFTTSGCCTTLDLPSRTFLAIQPWIFNNVFATSINSACFKTCRSFFSPPVSSSIPYWAGLTIFFFLFNLPFPSNAVCYPANPWVTSPFVRFLYFLSSRFCRLHFCVMFALSVVSVVASPHTPYNRIVSQPSDFFLRIADSIRLTVYFGSKLAGDRDILPPN